MKPLSTHLQAHESVRSVFRKHWLPFVGTLIPILLAAYVPVWAVQFITSDARFGTTLLPLVENASSSPIMFLYAVLLLLLFLSVFNVYSDMFLDACILTTHRVIDIEQMGFFHRESSIFRLEHIQDITVETRGFFQTVFGYGTLVIQTAGERQFKIPDVARPHNAKRMIMDAVHIARTPS